MARATVTALTERYRAIGAGRMAGLPIYNPRLAVEAVGFRALEDHQLGVLVTPWFMNLMLLPGTDDWSACAAGTVIAWPLPAGDFDLNLCRDDALGTFLSAVLFRSMDHFPDQDTARAIAAEVMTQLFAAPAARPAESAPAAAARSISRRDLLAALGAP